MVRGLTICQCWERLQQIDEAISELPADRHSRFEDLLENRQFFEEQLKRLLIETHRRDGTMANSERNDGPEQYGGKVQEQADMAEKALRYQDRFNQNREPNNHNMGDVDKVKG